MQVICLRVVNIQLKLVPKWRKILEGQRKSPVKNEVIGGHSPQINNSNDLFAVEELSVNADGTRNIKFVKDLQDGSISKIKKSTVFPDSWSDSKIIDTIKEVEILLSSQFVEEMGQHGIEKLLMVLKLM